MKKQVDIFIGEYEASQKPMVFRTVLGSCVAVCLFDPIQRIGGMNHILMPGKADLKHFDTAARYGVNAMDLLINKMMGLGTNRHRLVAKVFGGANVLPEITDELQVGVKNMTFVLEYLKLEKIRIISRDLGGYESRKIFFHTDTGEVLLQRIGTIQSRVLILEQEKKKAQIRRKAEQQGEITWFNSHNK